MARKKNTKKSATKNPESVEMLGQVGIKLNEVNIPGDLKERFGPQINRVVNRLEKIATNLAKAIELGVTKLERDAKKKDRIAKRREKLEAQIKATQDKLTALKD